MVEEHIKQFTGNPSPIEIVIEIMGFGDLDSENKEIISLQKCAPFAVSIKERIKKEGRRVNNGETWNGEL